MSKKELGQYFTTHPILQEKVYSFIKNKPRLILEPSVGRGDLIATVCNHNPDICFDLYEIDDTIEFLDSVSRRDVCFGNFLEIPIVKKYKTIIGNPPYVSASRPTAKPLKQKSLNLYLQFTNKCIDLLDDHGELIFIVPSDFFKATSALCIIQKMLKVGAFTDIFHPHNEKLFENASVDVVVYRYEKGCSESGAARVIQYNDNPRYMINTNGLITFPKTKPTGVKINNVFNVYVGMVSAKENIYRNEIGNIKVLNKQNVVESYIFIKKYPSGNTDIDTYLYTRKDELMSRKIRKFNNHNWFEWGAPRNITIMEEYYGKPCIYVHNLTRKPMVAFVGTVQYFNGGLIMLLPKQKLNLDEIVHYLNSEDFRQEFIFSGRFKIGHRQLCNSLINI